MEGTDDWAGSILCTSGHLTLNLFSFFFSFLSVWVCVCTSPPSLLFIFGWHSVTGRRLYTSITWINIIPENNITRVGLLLSCSIINTQQQTKRSTHFLMSIKKQKSDYCLTLRDDIHLEGNEWQPTWPQNMCIKKNKLVSIYSHGYYSRAVHVCVKWRYSIENKKNDER